MTKKQMSFNEEIAEAIKNSNDAVNGRRNCDFPWDGAKRADRGESVSQGVLGGNMSPKGGH